MTVVTTTSVDEGYYSVVGFHANSSENTFTGLEASENYNSFFAFNVPSTPQLITSAKFRVQIDSLGVYNLDPLETISLWDVTTPVSALLAGGTDKTAIHDDLQSGTNYATFSFTPVANSIYEISLSPAAISAINNSRRSTFALGVHLDTPEGKPVLDEGLRFGNTKSEALSDLILEVNDSPAEIILSGLNVTEHSPTGTVIGTLSTSDPNLGDTHTYQLLVNAGGRFGLSSDGESVVVTDGAALDFEQTPSHVITVRSTDPFGAAVDRAFTITLADVATEIGTRFNDVLIGGPGRESLFGLDGNDLLSAEAGRDLLVGGRGRDLMTGGSSADIFDFNAIRESGRTSATRDVITDFKRNTDDIDLRTIDSRTDQGGNNRFTFIGFEAFSGQSGELRLKDSGKHLIVQGDVNGDTRSDFEILVRNVASLKAGDFLL